MAKNSGGGCLVVVIVVGLLAFGYYKWDHGSSSAPPAGAATGDGTGRYVALGDSYTASPRTGKNVGTPPGCDRSDDNYPRLVSADLKPAEFVDVSCSGATTANLSAAQKTGNGSNPPQLDAVTSKTTLVTLGIGGNDIGFLSLASSCATAHRSSSPCKDKMTAGGHDQLAERIDATAPKVAAVLERIHQQAPKAKIVVVGYPSVLPDGDGCWPVLPIGAGDVAYFRGALGKLNKMLEDQADAHKAGYADTATPGKGHDVCTGSDTRWVEGVIPVLHGTPLHPNARGEQGMADAVLGVLKLF